MQQNIASLIIALVLLPIIFLAIWRLKLKRLALYHSPILGKIEVLQKYNGEKVLATNSYPQGISIEQESVRQSYWFTMASEAVKFCGNKKNPQVLSLGLGAGTTPNLIAQLNPKINQTIVEIEGLIIKVCKEFFGLDKIKNTKVIQADAFTYIQDGPKGRFDVIVVDIFLAIPPYISTSSNQPDFIKKLLSCLKQDGAIIFNRPGHTEAVRNDSQKLENYLKTLFKETKILDIKDPRGYRNSIITGTGRILKH